MAVPVRSRLLRVAPLLIIYGCYAMVYAYMRPVRLSDPDRYFHLSMARQSAEQGLPRAVPQVEDAGWGESYSDPFFLYTTISGGLYRLGGEPLTLAFTPFLALSILTLIYFIASESCSAMVAALITSSALLFPVFVNRLVLFRPHQLAMLLVLLLYRALTLKQWRRVFLWGMLFSLSYHASVAVLAVCFCFLIGLDEDSARQRKSALVGFAAVLTGLVINPYFPGNLKQEWKAISVGFNLSGISVVDRPMENLPISLRLLLIAIGPFGALVGWSCWKLWRESYPRSVGRARLIVRGVLGDPLLQLCVVFWCGTLYSARCLEYAIPFSLLLLAREVASITAETYGRLGILGAAGLMFWNFSLLFLEHRPDPLVDSAKLFDAIAQIPKDGSVRKVFTCDYAIGSYLLYARPDLHFVDAMDPTFLLEANPGEYKLRIALRSESVAFPYGIVKYAFGSDMALCGGATLIRQFEIDPQFRRSYPLTSMKDAERNNIRFFLYSFSPRVLSNYVQDYEASLISGGERPTVPDLKWISITHDSAIKPEQRSPYIAPWRAVSRQLAARQLAGRTEEGERCVVVRPDADQVRSHSGSRLLGVGGAGRLQLWLNDSLIFSRPDRAEPPRALRFLVPLEEPLTGSERISAVICSSEPATMGFALSFWSESEVAGICREKHADDSLYQWSRLGDRTQRRLITCLTPDLPSVLRSSVF